jgi:hypothetical protein
MMSENRAANPISRVVERISHVTWYTPPAKFKRETGPDWEARAECELASAPRWILSATIKMFAAL